MSPTPLHHLGAQAGPRVGGLGRAPAGTFCGGRDTGSQKPRPFPTREAALGRSDLSVRGLSHVGGAVAQQVQLQVLVPVAEQQEQTPGGSLQGGQVEAVGEVLGPQPAVSLGSR